MRVADVYRPGALTCEASDPVADAARKMVSGHVGALAVLDGNMIVGMLSERDVLRAVAEHADTTEIPAGRFASRHVKTAGLNEETSEVARRMLDAGVRHLPVVQDSTVVGMLSMRDLLAVDTWI